MAKHTMEITNTVGIESSSRFLFCTNGGAKAHKVTKTATATISGAKCGLDSIASIGEVGFGCCGTGAAT